MKENIKQFTTPVFITVPIGSTEYEHEVAEIKQLLKGCYFKDLLQLQQYLEQHHIKGNIHQPKSLAELCNNEEINIENEFLFVAEIVNNPNLSNVVSIYYQPTIANQMYILDSAKHRVVNILTGCPVYLTTPETDFMQYCEDKVTTGEWQDYVIPALSTKTVWVHQPIYTTKKPIDFKSFIGNEVEDAGTYIYDQVNSWIIKYGFDTDTMVVRASKEKWVAASFIMQPELLPIAQQAYNSNKHGFDDQIIDYTLYRDGFIIEETIDDEDGSFIFVITK